VLIHLITSLCVIFPAVREATADTLGIPVSDAVINTILSTDSLSPVGRATLSWDWRRLDTNVIWDFAPDGKIQEYRSSKDVELAFDGDKIRFEARYRKPNPRGGKIDIWETQAFDGDKLEVFVVWTEDRTGETKSEGAIYDSYYLNTDTFDPRVRGLMNRTTVSEFLRGKLKPWLLTGVDDLGAAFIDSLECREFGALVAANGDSVYAALAPSWSWRPRRMTLVSREVRQVTDYRFSRVEGFWLPVRIDIETDRIDPANGHVTPYTVEKLIYEYSGIAHSPQDSVFTGIFPPQVTPEDRRRGNQPTDK